jgi:hypothetical protein
VRCVIRCVARRASARLIFSGPLIQQRLGLGESLEILGTARRALDLDELRKVETQTHVTPKTSTSMA